MEKTQKKVQSYYRQAFIEGNISINDLREKLDNGIELTTGELASIKNFEHYQISVLTKEMSDDEFNKKYQQLQVLANLGSFEEFLKEKYTSR
ncbi:MAG: hypothetical protein JKY42_04670 [Flavobacteriales bacterium]|nr:hypothetical protein [Flavobacteriales bacterium]